MEKNNQNTDSLEMVFKEEKTQLCDVWGKIQYGCHYLPILTTVAFIIEWVFDVSKAVGDGVLFPLACIGWLAALLTGPVKFLKGILRCTGIGWNVGAVIGMVGALVGGALGTVAGLAIIMFFPAVFTMIQRPKE